MSLSCDAFVLPRSFQCGFCFFETARSSLQIQDSNRGIRAFSKSIDDDVFQQQQKPMPTDNTSPTPNSERQSHDNKAMQFLRKIGRVGGEKVDFTNAIGVDEGSSTKTAGKWSNSGMTPMKKSKAAFRSCTESGTIDDMSEDFPVTSSGTQWSGVTDRVMGGMSSATLSREVLSGRRCNVLRAHVSLDNGGGFVQMATDLAIDPAISESVDASAYGGLEMDVLYAGEAKVERFNVQ
jgi:Complex I intermediate-associated protein 30 (CIA30)